MASVYLCEEIREILSVSNLFVIPITFLKNNVSALISYLRGVTHHTLQSKANLIFMLTHVHRNPSQNKRNKEITLAYGVNKLRMVKADPETIYIKYGPATLLSLLRIPSTEIDSVIDKNEVQKNLVDLDMVHNLDFTPDIVRLVVSRCQKLMIDHPNLWNDHLLERYALYFNVIYDCIIGGGDDFTPDLLMECLNIYDNQTLRCTICEHGCNFRLGLLPEEVLLGACGFSREDLKVGLPLPSNIASCLRNEVLYISHGIPSAVFDDARKKNDIVLESTVRKAGLIHGDKVSISNQTNYMGVPIRDCHPYLVFRYCDSDGNIHQQTPIDVSNDHDNRDSDMDFHQSGLFSRKPGGHHCLWGLQDLLKDRSLSDICWSLLFPETSVSLISMDIYHLPQKSPLVVSSPGRSLFGVSTDSFSETRIRKDVTMENINRYEYTIKKPMDEFLDLASATPAVKSFLRGMERSLSGNQEDAPPKKRLRLTPS